MTQVSLAEFGNIEQHLENSWHAQNHSTFLLSNRFQDFERIEFAMQNDCAASDENRNKKSRQTARVIKGREHWTDVIFPQLPADGSVVTVPGHHAMRDHHPLRLSCRTARIQKTINIFRV